MQINAKQYAQGLYELIADQDESQIKLLIEKWLNLIANNRDFSQIEEIINQFSLIWQAEQGILEAEITSKRELNPETLKTVTEYVKQLTKTKRIVWQKIINNKMLGGVIIKYQDQVIDASLKTALAKLKNNIVN